MNLKGLITEVERLVVLEGLCTPTIDGKFNSIKLQGIKQTVEAVNNDINIFGKIVPDGMFLRFKNMKESKDWQKLMKLLDIK